jgi:hypothetical protein
MQAAPASTRRCILQDHSTAQHGTAQKLSGQKQGSPQAHKTTQALQLQPRYHQDA